MPCGKAPQVTPKLVAKQICTLASQCEFYTNLVRGSGGERGEQTLPPNP